MSGTAVINGKTANASKISKKEQTGKSGEMITIVKKKKSNVKTKPVTLVPYGQHYERKEGKKTLKANIKYSYPVKDEKGNSSNYNYTTDERGRITSVTADSLILEKGKRKWNAQRNVGKGEGRKQDDDGGHLIGTQFLGSGDIDNMVPQNSKFNRNGGLWYAMEKEWADALSENPPKKVSVDIHLVYKDDLKRPAQYIVSYVITDKNGTEKRPAPKIFLNEDSSIVQEEKKKTSSKKKKKK